MYEKYKKVAELPFNLQFDIVMVQNSSSNLENKFSNYRAFTHFCSFPIPNNGKMVNRGSDSW